MCKYVDIGNKNLPRKPFKLMAHNKTGCLS